MEVGEVRKASRTVYAYSVQVATDTGRVILSIDEQDQVWIRTLLGHDIEQKVRVDLANFGAAYLRPVHAAIGAVLEAMEEDA